MYTYIRNNTRTHTYTYLYVYIYIYICVYIYILMLGACAFFGIFMIRGLGEIGNSAPLPPAPSLHARLLGFRLSHVSATWQIAGPLRLWDSLSHIGEAESSTSSSMGFNRLRLREVSG